MTAAQPQAQTGASSITVRVPEDVPKVDMPPNFCPDEGERCPANDPQVAECDKPANWGLHYHYGPDAVAWLHLGDADYRPLTVDSALSLASSLKWWAEKNQRESVLRHD